MAEFCTTTTLVCIGETATGQQDRAGFTVGILEPTIGVETGQVVVSQIRTTKLFSIHIIQTVFGQTLTTA